MNKVILLIIFCISQISFSIQKTGIEEYDIIIEKLTIENVKESDKIYFDSFWLKVDNKEDGEYYRLIHKEENGMYLFTDHLLDGSIQSIGKTPDINDARNRDEGEITFYFFENGNIEMKQLGGNGYISEWWAYNTKGDMIDHEKLNNGTGELRMYHKNGNLEGVYPFKEGKSSGIMKKYDEDGNLLIEINFLNGKENGEGKWFYKNGNESFQGYYSEGEKIGEWKVYSAEGKLLSKYIFEEGELKDIIDY